MADGSTVGGGPRRAVRWLLVCPVLLGGLAGAAAEGDGPRPAATAAVVAVLSPDNGLAVTVTLDLPSGAVGRYVIHRPGDEPIRDVAVQAGAGPTLEPGSVTVQRRDRFVVLHWPVQSAGGRYVISYRLVGPVSLRPDAAVLVCDLVGAGQAHALAAVRVDLAVPGGMAAVRGVPVLRTGARSASWSPSDDGIRLQASDLPAQAYLRLELYLARDAVGRQFSFSGFMGRRGAPLALWLPPILALSVLLALYWARGRDPRLRPEGEAVERPSPGMTPEIAGTLVDEYTEPRDLLAAVVDLARGGALRLVQVPGQGPDSPGVRIEPGVGWDALSSLRRSIAEAVAAASPGDACGPIRAEGGLPRAGLRALADAVQKGAAEAGFFRRSPGAERRLYRGIGLGLLVAGVGLAALAGDATWVARAGYGLFLAGLPFLLLAPLMPQRTLRGAREKARLFAYQAYLTALDPGLLEPERRQAVFEEGLPYAIAFRLRKEWINRFSAVGVSTPVWWQVAGQESTPPPPLADTREALIQTLSVLSSALGESPFQGGGG